MGSASRAGKPDPRRHWPWRILVGLVTGVAAVMMTAVVALRPATATVEQDLVVVPPQLPPPVQASPVTGSGVTPAATPGPSVTPTPSVIRQPVAPVRPNTRTRAS